MKRAGNAALQFAPEVRRAVLGDRIVVLSALHSLMASKSIFGRVHECIETAVAPCPADRKVASIYIRKMFAMGALTTEAPEVELVSWSDRRRLLHERSEERL